EAHRLLTLRTLLRVDAAVTMQDRRDRAQARDRSLPQLSQPLLQLARTPTRMLVPQGQYRGLHRRRRAPRRAMRPARPIRQASLALGLVTPQPLVTDPRLDLVAPAQLSHVRALSQSQHHKLAPQRHGTHLSPRHRTAPFQSLPMPSNVFTMSPNTRSP